MTSKTSLIAFEKKIERLFLNKKIKFPVHFSGEGNEDFLIDLFKKIQKNDYVFATHRNHYHALLKGISEEELEEQIINNGSMHIYNKEFNFFTSAIVGGCLPIALGVSIAFRRKDSKNRVWVFVGDMGSEMGVFHECSKYAARHELPITFIIEDNGLSIDTPTQKIWGESSNPPNIIKYEYNREWPHVGCGQWITF